MNNGDNLEVEVKFYVPDLAAVRRRLLDAGAQAARPRQLERNLRYDTVQERLRFQGQLLRLRHDDRLRLTFKGLAPEDTQSEAKVREEIEVTVDNLEQMALILERLGFVHLQSYEKYRETFVLDGVEIVLDELPYGNFVELEGEEGAIRAVAAQLGFAWSERVLLNYLGLMSHIRAYYQLPFNDLTFDNFAGRSIDIPAVLETIERA